MKMVQTKRRNFACSRRISQVPMVLSIDYGNMRNILDDDTVFREGEFVSGLSIIHILLCFGSVRTRMMKTLFSQRRTGIYSE